MQYDAKERICAWCYVLVEDMKKCADCSRAYCSRDCQIKDWKVGHHKTWCGKAGEKCVDYEIRDAGEKGLGLFTLRDFERGEKILVERPVVTGHGTGQSLNRDQLKIESVMKATMALAPIESASLHEKFLVNAAALGDTDQEGKGLFLNFSRINHDCIGNSTHYYDPDFGLKLLVANHDIPKGAEVTFSYTSNKKTQERALMMSFRGFQCTCIACKNQAVANKLDRVLDLDKKIMDLGCRGKTEQAIRAGTALLKLYDDLQLSDFQRVRTYYDLFQVAITKQKTVREGQRFIQEGYKHALQFYGRETHPEVQKYKQYAQKPSLHRNYRCIN
ncbi:hypothetical protein ACHAWF_018346 [Thalassiosira exigua]